MEEQIEELNTKLIQLNETLTSLSIALENNNRYMNELIGVLKSRR